MYNPLTPQGRYLHALAFLLENEGGYSNQVLDHGGETNFGITEAELSRVWETLNLPRDVKNLSEENAEKYYKIEWWDKYHLEAINSYPIAAKIFDLIVNMGSYQGIKLVQLACNYCGQDLVDDGILGPKTIAAINELSYHKSDDQLMQEIIYYQTEFYLDLVHKNTDLNVFLKGWLKRASLDPSKIG